MEHRNNVIIRKAKKDDMYQVCQLIKELAIHEKCEQECVMTPEILIADGFASPDPPFKMFVADVNGQIVGYSAYFNGYRTNTGNFIFLQDLFVSLQYRNEGIGKKLFQSVAKVASKTASKRLELHCLSWNPSLEFYLKMGFRNTTEINGWNYLIIDGDNLSKHVE
ncbi:hypothetical protein PPYR_04452 [Photinus pyralis]|uniref:N-acetyltransferase domain-containing protein n=1 Tax=Photinus pyralis TaxID=7054 RepID=A0A1Y1KZR6_PHOPY|nr:diamine acetyltransferase 2-like [Photinus pyralis]KAB0802266.1 hypothetical protein PPYR_04452 [Photinus pyralis]